MYTDAPFMWEWMNYSLANPIFFLHGGKGALYPNHVHRGM